MNTPFAPMYQQPFQNPWSQQFQPNQFNPVQLSFNKPIEGIIRVTGRQGAEAYQLPPNSYMPLFDGDSDTLYIKSTDGAGFGTVQEYQIIPKQQEPKPSPDYVTQVQFDELKKELEDVKYNIQQSQQAHSDAVTVSFSDTQRYASNQCDARGQSGKHDAPTYEQQSSV